MATVSFGQLVDPEQEAIDRQKKLADALRTQSLQPYQNETAGGRTVPYAWTQGVAKLAQALMANKKEADAGERQTALRGQQQEQAASEVQGIISALRGSEAKPATPEVQGNNPSAYVPAQPAQDATPGDSNEALKRALMSRSPAAQSMAGALMTAALPKPAKMERMEVPDGKGGTIVGFANMNAPNPMSTFQPAGTAPEKMVPVNGQFASPTTGQTMGQAIPKQPDAPNAGRDLLVPDPTTGQMVPNQALIDARKQIAKSGASSNNISVSADKGYAGEVAKLQAQGDVAAVQAAQGAPQIIATSQRIRKLLDTSTPITGTGADIRLGLNKAFATAGLVDPKDANATEALVSDLNKQTLATVKSSGLGAGNGFTDKDLQFLQSAASGSISMTPANIRRQAELAERAAREAIKKGQQVQKVWNDNKDKLGIAPSSANIQEPPQYIAPGKPASGGATFLGFEK